MIFHTVSHRLLNNNAKKVNVIPIYDVHIGDPNFAERDFKEQVYEIRQTPTLVFLGGDLINNGLKSSVSNCYEETMKPRAQVDYLVNLLKPIKDRIIGAVEGNHERRSTLNSDQSPTEVYCLKLGCPYFGDEAFMKLRFGKDTKEGDPINYGFYGIHGGKSGGSTIGAKANALSRLGHIVVADVYMQGHLHTRLDFDDALYLPDMRTCTVNTFLMKFVMAGAWLNRDVGYAVQGAFKPARIGSPTIILDGKKKKVEVLS